MEELLVRLKPLNERKGHNLKVYMVEGARFNVERGWYRVPADFGERLRDVHQDHYDEESPFAFDVCTEEQARKLEEKERRELMNERATVSQPSTVQRVSPRKHDVVRGGGDMTTADLNPVDDDEPAMIDGADEDDEDVDEDDGRLTEVGKVASSGGRRPTTTRPGKIRTKK